MMKFGKEPAKVPRLRRCLPRITARITALRNEILKDDNVGSQLAKIVLQDDDLQSKVRAVKEYNKVRGRII